MQLLAQTTTQTWISSTVLINLGLGFALGALGQAARAIVGLKKTADEARAKNTTFSSEFQASQLLVSLLIGGVAGALATIAMLEKMNALTRDTLVALIGAGYAGADFIEGFIRDAGAGVKSGKTDSTNGANGPPKKPEEANQMLPESRPANS